MDLHSDPLRAAYVDYENAGLPMSMHVDLTYDCPLKCVHCYARDMENVHPVTMDTGSIKRLLDQAAELGVLIVTFSGGEPWVRRDLRDVVTYARKLNFLVRLKTSGVMMTQRDVDLFAELGLVWVEISIHGLKPETHDAVTRVAGSHAKAMKAVRMLQDAGIRVYVNTSALMLNYREIPDMVRYFKENIGITPRVSLYLSPGQVVGDQVMVHGTDREASIEVYTFLLDGIEPDYKARTSVDPFDRLCFAGRAAFHVGPDGLVHPCIVWPEIAGDLKTQSLKEIWFDSPLLKRIRTMVNRDRTGCRTCNLFGYCNFCPGRAFQEAGGPTLPYESACREARWTREAYERKFGFAPDAPPKD